jgi:type III secretion protein SpaR/YscT/HrcT
VSFSVWSTPFEHTMIVLMIALARIGPAFLFLPFLSDKTLGRGVLRGTLLAMVAIGLLPLPALSELNTQEISFASTLMKEAIIGLLLGLSFGAPWFAVQTCGELIDNQRGATMANAIDPATGIEASPVASFLAFLWTAIFLSSGGMQKLLGLLAASYERLSITGGLNADMASAIAVGKLLSASLLAGIGVAAPTVIAMLLTELLLGVLSRFAPQLNAFSVALTVKSIIACLILLMYVNPNTFVSVNHLFNTRALNTLFDPARAP